MTPHPTHPRRALSRQALRRGAAVLAGALVVGSTPFVAHALAEDAGRADAVAPAAAAIATRTGSSWFELPDLAPTVLPVTRPRQVAAPDPALVALAVVMDTYAWDEQSPRVIALQQVLGLWPDGWYSHSTLAAQRGALQWLGLPIENLPVPPVPAGTSADQWAALRTCESGGNYSATSRSGRYRGAYQFNRSTWNSVAARHAPHLAGVDPAAASPADQDAMAFALYGDRGWRPWPHCGRHLR